MEETHSKQIMAKTFNHMCKSSKGEAEGTIVRGLHRMNVKSCVKSRTAHRPAEEHVEF